MQDESKGDSTVVKLDFKTVVRKSTFYSCSKQEIPAIYNVLFLSMCILLTGFEIIFHICSWNKNNFNLHSFTKFNKNLAF